MVQTLRSVSWIGKARVKYSINYLRLALLSRLNVMMEFLPNIAAFHDQVWSHSKSSQGLVSLTHTAYTQLSIISSYTPEDGAPVTD